MKSACKASGRQGILDWRWASLVLRLKQMDGMKKVLQTTIHESFTNAKMVTSRDLYDGRKCSPAAEIIFFYKLLPKGGLRVLWDFSCFPTETFGISTKKPVFHVSWVVRTLPVRVPDQCVMTPRLCFNWFVLDFFNSWLGVLFVS